MKKSSLILVMLFSLAGAAKTIVPAVKARADSVLICQSKSAYAYHAYECRGLARCTHGVIKVTKAQAIKMGYRACKICFN